MCCAPTQIRNFNKISTIFTARKERVKYLLDSHKMKRNFRFTHSWNKTKQKMKWNADITKHKTRNKENQHLTVRTFIAARCLLTRQSKQMEADVLNALQSQAAYLPGGRDRDERLLMLIPVPNELQPWTKQNLDLSIKFLLSILR